MLFTLTFKHLGIFKLTPEKVEAGSENIRRVKAEMYCETDSTFKTARRRGRTIGDLDGPVAAVDSAADRSVED